MRAPYGGPSKELVDRFVEAFNARDVPRVTALLLEKVSIEAQGVGGGRGREGEWLSSTMSIAHSWVEGRIYHGEAIVLHLRSEGSRYLLDGISRFEESDGQISRILDYYCPETLAEVGSELGLPVATREYHQSPEILPRMIASSKLPWVSS